jgi:hypothetical protein
MSQIPQLKVVACSTQGPDSPAAAQSALGVARLRDVLEAGAVFRVCCGTCHHVEEVPPATLGLPEDLPVAEVRRGLTCTACGGRWVDVREAHPRATLKVVRAGC